MTITTKELGTIEDFEALKCGDIIAYEYHGEPMQLQAVVSARNGLLNCRQLFSDYRHHVAHPSDCRVTLIESDVNGGK